MGKAAGAITAPPAQAALPAPEAPAENRAAEVTSSTSSNEEAERLREVSC